MLYTAGKPSSRVSEAPRTARGAARVDFGAHAASRIALHAHGSIRHGAQYSRSQRFA
jgi:hypothetical protein